MEARSIKMATDTNALQDFRNFPGITEAWELVQTGIIVIREQLYRLELWRSYSNPDIAYYVSVYVQEKGVWKRMPDPIFPIGLDADQTMREAMAFLSEKLAA
jgi:hypothetical protein